MLKESKEYLSNKIKWLAILATWAVVGIHSRTTEWVPGVVDWSSMVQNHLIEHFSFAVPLFFLISGYWFMKSYGRYGWRDLLLRKFKSLYVPFVCWCLIGELAVLPSCVIEHQEFSWRTIAGVPILLMNGLHLSWHLWYVRALIVFFLLAPVCYWIGKYLVLVVVAIVLTRFVPTLTLWNYHFGYVVLAVPWFFLGCLCSTHNLLERIAPKYVNVLITVISVSCIVLLDVFGDWNIQYFTCRHEIRIVFMIFVLWFGYDVLEVKTGPARWLQHTFFVYCLHTCVIRYTGNGLRYFLGVSPLVKMISFVLNMCTFWIDVLISAFVARYLPKGYGILVGGR